MTLSPPDLSDRVNAHAGDVTGRGGMAVAFSVPSVMAHLAALAVVVSLAAKLPPAAPDGPAIPVLFTAPAAPSSAATQQPEAVARSVLVPPSTAVPIVLRPAYHLAYTRPNAPAAPRMRQTPSARAMPTAAAPIAAPLAVSPAEQAPPATDDGAVLLHLTGQIQADVRAAATMPQAALRQRRTGRVQVHFAYLDGQVQAVAVAQSSHSRLLDDAALSAVQSAHYPPPPPRLRGRLLPLLVWIDFRLNSPSPG